MRYKGFERRPEQLSTVGKNGQNRSPSRSIHQEASWFGQKKKKKLEWQWLSLRNDQMFVGRWKISFLSGASTRGRVYSSTRHGEGRKYVWCRCFLYKQWVMQPRICVTCVLWIFLISGRSFSLKLSHKLVWFLWGKMKTSITSGLHSSITYTQTDIHTEYMYSTYT